MRAQRYEGRHKVAVVGIGKQGLLLIERLSRRSDMELVAIVDASPEKVGRLVDEIAATRTGFRLSVGERLDAIAGADVALVATSSRIADVGPDLERIADLGVNVITTCEELAYPWHQFPEESRRVDAAARVNGVSVVACGSNPGFVMDLVPMVFSFGCERIDAITIQRALDMRPHRSERLRRFALGKTPLEFAALSPDVLIGHVGFTQSIHCLADGVGWQLDTVTEGPVQPCVITTKPRRGEYVTLQPGTVAVVEHRATAYHGGEKIIDLTMYLGFHDQNDAVPHGDLYEIQASDQLIRIRAHPSWSPFTATPSTVINMVEPIQTAEPGLLSVIDFPPRRLAPSRAAVAAAGPLRARNYLAGLSGDGGAGETRAEALLVAGDSHESGG